MNELQKELTELLAKRDAIRAKQFDSFVNGSATRAKTTTGNANADRCNDRIEWLRSEIRRVAVRECDDGYPSCRVAEKTGMWCEGRCHR